MPAREMSMDIVPQSRSWRLSGRILAMAAALSVSSAILFWFLRRRRSISSNSANIFREAEHKKACGVEAYRQKKFEEAIRFFSEAIDEVRKVGESGVAEEEKLDELMSSCENNNAASFDALGDTERCLYHCGLALQINPNYVKAMARRAKCHFKLGQNDKALSDYLDLIAMEGVSKEHKIAYQYELDRVSDAIIVPLLDESIQCRIGKPMKISQMLVFEWMYSTVTNDPLLARMAKLPADCNDEQISALDVSLLQLKRGAYDEVASLAIPIIDDETNDSVERMLAVLLAARFLSYQSLNEQAKEIARKFDLFWGELEEAQKLAHKDVHVAYITLQLILIDLIENEPTGNSENATIDETAKQRCHQLVEDGLRINPKNLLIAIHIFSVTFGVRLIHSDQDMDALGVFQKAKKLDQKHPFLRFHETHARLSIGIRQQSFIEIQNQMFTLQQTLMESERVPTFVFIILSKFAMALQNNHLALEACKKTLEKMPNCAYAIYLLGLLNCNPNSLSDPAGFEHYVQNIERAMRKAIEMDANYWEPYRMLGKIYADKERFSEAIKFYSDAISLARKREELMVLWKEQLMIGEFVRRKEQGKKLPRGMATNLAK